MKRARTYASLVASVLAWVLIAAAPAEDRASASPAITCFLDMSVVSHFSPDVSALAVALQGTRWVVAGGGRVARYLSDGSPDLSFGGTGSVEVPIGVEDVATQPDGKIVVGGDFDFDFAVARLLPNGGLDPLFGNGGVVLTDFGSAQGYAVAVQPDGMILLAGSANGKFAAARYTPSGQLDPTFGRGGLVATGFGPDSFGSGARGMAVQGNGAVVLAGYVDDPSGERFALVRYDPTGALDPSFGVGGRVATRIGPNALSLGVAIQRDARIVAVGNGEDEAGSQGGFAVARYLPDGRLDDSFGGTGIVTTFFEHFADTASGVALESDGSIVVAGDTYEVGGIYRHRTAWYAPDGQLEYSAGGGWEDYSWANDVVVSQGQRVVIVGGMDGAGSFGIARYRRCR